MDREIKFKGKRVVCVKWIYGGYAKGIGHISDKRRKERFYIGYMPIYMEEVDPETVCQYTGLKDKNGTEIYEGDLFRVGDRKEIFEVRFSDGCFLAYFRDEQVGIVSELQTCFIEKVGNKFDNPQLLEGK